MTLTKSEIICRFFSYSLDERILPRHKVLLENRINFKLRYMLATSDEEFQNLVENAVERRRRFESGVMNVTLSKSLVADNSSEERKAFEHGEMVDVQTNSQVTDDPSDPSDEEEISYFSDT